MSPVELIRLNDLKVGGKPVEFKVSTGTLCLAGDDLTLEQWQELERRLNLLFQRAGLIEDPKKNKSKDPASGTSSFLTHNLKQILARDEGIIKDPPLWLKGFYSGVITKDKLWEL